MSLIAIVAAGQYFLAGLESFVTGIPRAMAWWSGGIVVVLATIRIETYFVRKRKWGP